MLGKISCVSCDEVYYLFKVYVVILGMWNVFYFFVFIGKLNIYSFG